MISRSFWGLVAVAAVFAWGSEAAAAQCDTSNPTDLVVDGITCELSGVLTRDTISVINGGVIAVYAYDGNPSDLISTGNLELRANTIFVDATSTISAVGAGYQTLLCDNGAGPTAEAGGRGGCEVFDSGGGGAHFGRGGQGTKDCNGLCSTNNTTCEFPAEFEEACGGGLNASGTSCDAGCSAGAGADPGERQCDGSDPTSGLPFFHSIYRPEFGAGGGDKGCYDGFGGANTSGPGGGRIVLAAVNATGTGTVTIDGTLTTEGRRGCGTGNDSAGGGAGGSLLIAGDAVFVSATASVSSAGGLGGDTQTDAVCGGLGFQQGGTCDDCGGGGGGGIITVLSGASAAIEDEAVFNVNGGLGGSCAICQGEAGGGAGELQISGAFVGELCDDFDNDFDGLTDEGFAPLTCDGMTLAACAGGFPQQCPVEPSCVGAVDDTRARFLIIADTSASMLLNLDGEFTFGDGSTDHPGLDTNGDGEADDSRLFLAKQALTTVIGAYPEIDFALARYHQDAQVDRGCQLAHWFECSDSCCSYDNPSDNTGPVQCSIDHPFLGSIDIRPTSTGDECVNYAGSCGPPRRGADVLAGFGSDINQYLMWLDQEETNFNDTQVQGDHCDFAGGGDCELRGTGPTPLGGALESARDFLEPIVGCDAAAIGGCRSYGVILLTDGAESCAGFPATAASTLLADLGVETFVVGFSVLASEEAELNAIANAGSASGVQDAFLVGDQDELANALASIVSDSIVFETCNNADDDCDGLVDEDFPSKGDACTDGAQGICQGTGNRVCNGAGTGTVCDITNPGQPAGVEVCNGLDDNCNNLVDEGLSCIPDCTPTGPDLCDGIDNDCDGAIDEDDPLQGTQCGTTDQGTCEFGMNLCIAGSMECVGQEGPGNEICNGLDDDCDGNADNEAECPGDTSCIDGGCRLSCTGGEFSCPVGFDCLPEDGGLFCVPSPCAACSPAESCIDNACVDLCAGVTCESNETCTFGNCYDCNILGCESGEVCFDAECIADPCSAVDCTSACDGDSCSCVGGECIIDCDDEDCADGERCAADGRCTPNTCADVVCSSGVCADGQCIDNPCTGVDCGLGDVCLSGECIPDPCSLVECSVGRACEVREDGSTFCKSTGEIPPPERVTVGGGGGQGCSTGGTSGGTSGGLGLYFVLAGLLLLARRRREALCVATLTLLACNINVYEFGQGSGSSDDAGVGGNDANGDGGVTGSDGGGPCIFLGPDDQCDNIDNDCNGIVDDAFDKTVDGNNCGGCGIRCTAPGTILECQESACVITDCQPGFVDLDPKAPGCEYACPLFPARAEDCNGVDDDCDGLIDEPADLPPPPADQCRNTAGTPCEGTSMLCEERGGETRWYCDYSAEVEFDPSVPNGIFLQETLCDGFDGDCDGLADDVFTDLGQECDNSELGNCRDVGARVCDPADTSATICDLGVLPDAIGAATQEVCNGLDDDCDGIVDNSTGAERVVDDMVHVTHSGLDFYIYRHEASRPDASVGSEGVGDERSCSNSGVQPWTRTTMAVAEAACAASGSGRRLCTGPEYQAACAGPTGTVYPYGDAFSDQMCNSEPFDSIAGGDDDDVLLATDSATCSSADGVIDLSGNLKEWTNDITGQTPSGVDIAVLRGGAYNTPGAAATCGFRSSRASVESILETVGFRCCSDVEP
tara:strand:+ start:17734 stop:22719 length:4986 start_codon:yes stop_codon:yes gene_type:complete